MIFSKSPALHNQMHKSQEKRTENTLLLHIVFSRQSPGTRGHHGAISMFGWPLPSAGDAWILKGGEGGLMGITPF